jgi:hypothetical protein
VPGSNNIVLRTTGGDWQFGTDGQLTVPGDITTPITPQVGTIVYNLPDYDSSLGSNQYVWVQSGLDAVPVYELISAIGDMTGCIFTNELGVEYTVIQDFSPDSGGGLTLEFDSAIPSGHTYTVRSPDYVAKIVPALNVNVDENLWTFSADGSLTLPGNSELSYNETTNTETISAPTAKQVNIATYFYGDTEGTTGGNIFEISVVATEESRKIIPGWTIDFNNSNDVFVVTSVDEIPEGGEVRRLINFQQDVGGLDAPIVATGPVGALELTAGNNSWTFGADGQLTVPGQIRKDGGLYMNSGGDGISSTVFVNGTAGSVILRTDNGTSNKSLTLDVEGVLTFPDGTTSTGKSITVPLDDSLTVNLSFDNMPGSINTSFKVNPLSIKLPTGNGNIYSNGETAAERWSLDSANKTFYFPDAGDGVSPQIRYSTPGNDGMELFTAAKPIKITVASNTQWIFNADSSLTLPADSSILTNETALNIATSPTATYTFNQAYWEALNANVTRMFTPSSNAQYFACTVTANQNGAYTVNVTGIGNGFNPGNWFKIPGDELGGTTPANDIQITIATINGGGGILTTTITGTAVSKQWQFGTDGTLTLPSGGALDANFIDSQWIDVWLTAPQGATKTAGVRDFFGKTVAYTKENSFVIESNRAIAPKVWTFSESGDITLPASGDVVNSTGVSQLANRVEGSWTVTTGTNTYSFTVPSDGTYTMWVKGNIPNGIITWNATLSISNTNVPAIGTQYAWNYTGGGTPISLTSIPNQIRGSAGTISTDATYAGTTSNRFDFGISNTSGASVTVYYGYTKV